MVAKKKKKKTTGELKDDCYSEIKEMSEMSNRFIACYDNVTNLVNT